MKRQVFTLGDNSFWADPSKNHALFKYILNSTGQSHPRVCVIPTASGDAADYIDLFRRFMSGFGVDVTVLSLFRGETEHLENVIQGHHLIYVTGGNTRNMLVLWREWGLEPILRRAYERGVVLAGGSAGSLCWYESGLTDSIPGRFSAMKCLGWLKGSHCPHFNELTRRPDYLKAVGAGELPAGFAVDNGAALHFVNETLVEAIAGDVEVEGKSPAAYRVERDAQGVVLETALPTRVIR